MLCAVKRTDGVGARASGSRRHDGVAHAVGHERRRIRERGASGRPSRRREAHPRRGPARRPRRGPVGRSHPTLAAEKCGARTRPIERGPRRPAPARRRRRRSGVRRTWRPAATTKRPGARCLEGAAGSRRPARAVRSLSGEVPPMAGSGARDRRAVRREAGCPDGSRCRRREARRATGGAVRHDQDADRLHGAARGVDASAGDDLVDELHDRGPARRDRSRAARRGPG